MTEQNSNPLQGLSTEQVKELELKYGKNELVPEKKSNFFREMLKALSEPMFLLLLVTAVIYFILGEPRDGAIMLIFVVGIISIDIMQEWKTDKTLTALKDLSAPHVKVIRDGEEKMINSADLVPGDIMFISEGSKIPADGVIVRLNDLCVDESSLTGEAEGVWKTVSSDKTETQKDLRRRDYCYAGTLVTQGSAAVCIDKTGASTEYGKIGSNIAKAPENPSPLQKQTGSLVKLCAVIAAVLLALVSCMTWLNIPDHMFKDRLIESVLSGITLAMAMIPEEFPVILTVFLSMGAWRLAKKQSLVRKLPAVETLGAVSVLCVDKTGTITMNQMTVRETYPIAGNEFNLCKVMGMGCETEAYDPMEKAMLSYCEKKGITKEQLFDGDLLNEYSFTNEAKMMGHVWKNGDSITVAAKGSPERIIKLCSLTGEQRRTVLEKLTEMSQKGLRVIAVGEMDVDSADSVPATLQDCNLKLLGLVGLADPPRESVKNDIRHCTEAGVRVVMITGDNGVTASSIAKQVGIPNCGSIITGDELNRMSDEELRGRVKDVNIFSRVVPEHKMRIVKALKENGEVVAMTGDGVNDAPALKYADIGIAMGKRGSEVSREAADLILLDDNFSTIVDTIKDGRRIYDNIRKAIGYVFTIHIPIAFASIAAPLLKVNPAFLMLLPLHVVILELVIDPTCSIVLERQPAERDIMKRAPRKPFEKIISAKSLVKNLLQGLTVFAASFGTYYAFLSANPQAGAPIARTMGLVIILLSNILLVQVNSSYTDFAIQTLRRLVVDKVMWATTIITLLGILLLLYTPLGGFLKLAPLSFNQFILAALISMAAVLWYELVKLARHIKTKTTD